jgi:hypothetical protein
MPNIPKALPSVETVRAALAYNPDTGLFHWRRRHEVAFLVMERLVNSPAGYIRKSGYVTIKLNGLTYYAHRLAWLHFHGQDPVIDLDHINGSRGDNRITNLRLASVAENAQNQAKPCNNTSGYIGVHPSKGRFVALIGHNNEQLYLGTFDTAEEARAAYLEAKKRLHSFNQL